MNLLFTRHATSGKVAVNVVGITTMEAAEKFCGGSDDIPLAVVDCKEAAEHLEGGLSALQSLCDVSSDSGAYSICAALEHLLTLAMQFGFEHGGTTQQALDALKNSSK